MSLTLEQRQWLLIPKALPTSTHGDNLRKVLPKKIWDQIRKEVYERANNKCEICNKQGSKRKVEAHELWMFNFDLKTQYLERLVALCPQCHRVQHALLLKLQHDKGILNAEWTVKHLNKISNENYTFNSFFAKATEIFNKFDNIEWDVVALKEKDEIIEKFLF